MVGGVCSGFAYYFAKDVTIIRIVWTLAALIPPLFPGIAAYLVGWILMPGPQGSGSSKRPTGHAIASE